MIPVLSDLVRDSAGEDALYKIGKKNISGTVSVSIQSFHLFHFISDFWKIF